MCKLCYHFQVLDTIACNVLHPHHLYFCRTNSSGYFLVGTESVRPIPNIIINDNVLQDGPDAVALYHSPLPDFLRGTIATADNLIDAVVYGPSDNHDSGLLAKLAPAQVQIQESVPGEPYDWSLSRCTSNQTVSMLSFKSAPPSPGMLWYTLI